MVWDWDLFIIPASTSVSSEQPSLFSISSGSGGNPDESILNNTSITSEVTEVTEVTEGGAVFIVKKPTTDNGESSKNITQSPGIRKVRKHGPDYKNSSLRSSLNEEVLIDELSQLYNDIHDLRFSCMFYI